MRKAGASDLGARIPTGVHAVVLRRVRRRRLWQQHRRRPPRGRETGRRHDRPPLAPRPRPRGDALYRTVAPVVGCDVETHAGRATVRRVAPPGFSLVPGEPTEGVHLAFAAPDTASVVAFHVAGLAAGYASLGAPGERPEYHAGYYGASWQTPTDTASRRSSTTAPADALGEREAQLWASASRCCSAGAWMTTRFDHARYATALDPAQRPSETRSAAGDGPISGW